jgi:peptidoglycan/LPS O-acetylase OafA/YrhL
MKVKDPSALDFSLVPSNLLLLQAWGVNDHMGLNSPSWSLSAELFVYLLFPLLAVLLTRARPFRTLLAAALFTAAVESFRAHLGLRPSDLATFDFGVFRALPAFVAGMATQVVVASIPARPVSWVAPSAIGLLVVALMVFKAPPYLMIALFPVLVGMIALAERGGRPTIFAAPFFVLLGNASYAIYITHSFFQIASVSFVRKLGWTSPFGLAATALLFYIAIVACSVLSYIYFETPLRRLLAGSRPVSTQDRMQLHEPV